MNARRILCVRVIVSRNRVFNYPKDYSFERATSWDCEFVIMDRKSSGFRQILVPSLLRKESVQRLNGCLPLANPIENQFDSEEGYILRLSIF